MSSYWIIRTTSSTHVSVEWMIASLFSFTWRAKNRFLKTTCSNLFVFPCVCETQEREGSESGLPSSEGIDENNRSWFLATCCDGWTVEARILSNVCKLQILACSLNCSCFFDANVILDLCLINCYPMYGFRLGSEPIYDHLTNTTWMIESLFTSLSPSPLAIITLYGSFK